MRGMVVRQGSSVAGCYAMKFTTFFTQIMFLNTGCGDCSLVRRFCSPKARKSEIKGSSFRRFCSPKVRKSDNDFYSFLFKRFCSPKVRRSEIRVL